MQRVSIILIQDPTPHSQLDWESLPTLIPNRRLGNRLPRAGSWFSKSGKTNITVKTHNKLSLAKKNCRQNWW